jgi:hypothetical protein
MQAKPSAVELYILWAQREPVKRTSPGRLST